MSTKKLLLFTSLVLLTIVGHAQQTHKQQFEKLQWLVGKWKRTNAKPGEAGLETWTKVSNLKLTGKGLTLKGGKVIFTENLAFISKGDAIYYTVIITGDQKPVYFKLTAIDDNGFTCENPAHDFPKKITYTHQGNKAKAVISGNGQSIDYIFVRSGAKQ